jgi:hypothetical protein
MRRLLTWIKAVWAWATAHREEIEDVAEDVGDLLGLDKDAISNQLNALIEKDIRGHQVCPMTICAECYKDGFPTPALAVKEIIIGVGPKALVLQAADCVLHEDPDWIDAKRDEWQKLHDGGQVNG